MDQVEPVLDLAPRRLHRRVVGVGVDADRLAHDDRTAVERQAEAGAIPGVEIDSAPGDDGDRQNGPSGKPRQGDDPRPATRATLATSAVIATEAPSSSARISPRSAGAPPLLWTRPGRPPDPRTGTTPSRRSAAAWMPPSPLREISAAMRAIAWGQANDSIKCWPCHIAPIAGVASRNAASRSAGALTKRLVRWTRRR